MDKWAIRPDPAPHDPRRHLLLLKGTMTDVSLILRRFGAMCGRPKEVSVMPEGFNYSLILHSVTSGGLERLDTTLREMAPAQEAPATSAPTAAQTFPPLEPMPTLEAPSTLEAPPTLGGLSEPAPLGAAFEAPPTLPAFAEPQGLASVEPQELQPVEPQGLAPVEPQGLEPVEPAGLPPAPSLSEPPPVPVPMPSFDAPPPVPEPAAPEPVAAPAPAPEPEPTPTPAVAAVEAIRAGVVEPAPAAPSRPLWGLHQPLDAGSTFDTLLVGAYNRFAHAAATSVVSAPGTMYNPLFVYGPPGSGKTHIAHSIARALGQGLGADNVISTSGSRLAGAVTAALAEGRYAELEAVFLQAKAIVVDDIHLLSVTETNRAHLAQVFANFFGKNLQVVMTSIYPPRALGALEEALKISFGKGWSVDVKIPNPTIQAEIIRSQFDRLGLNLNIDESKRFHEMLGPYYYEAVRWARRLKRFVKLGAALGRNPTPPELFPMLFDPGVKAEGEEMPTATELAAVAAYKPPAPGADARNIAFLVPKGGEALAPWILARFFQTGGELGVTQTYRPVVVEAYDAQQPFGVPFQIGELCLRSGAQAVFVVGPPPDTQLAAREAEFSHAVARILDGLDAPMGWVKFKGTTALPNYLRAHLDLLGGLD